MIKTRQAFLVALTTSLTTTAFAEEPSPIIVTATRTAQTADESLASVTVITKEQIAQQQSTDLSDILSSVAGIDMINSGGLGKDTSLYMRGTDTGHVVVIIDGVQIGSATLGQAAYQDIPVDLIERIEVVRGSRSSLYGSEAIGGVIQIFTRRPSEKTSLNFSSLIGSYNTKKNTAGISGKISNTSYSFQGSTLSTDGYNAKQDNDPDSDGYTQQSLSAFLKYKFNETNSLEATLLHSDNINEYDGYTKTSDYYSEGLQQAIGLKSSFSALSNWQIELKANLSKDFSDQYKDNLKTGIYNTQREIYTWQNDISLNENNLLTVGAENKSTIIIGTSSYTKKSRDNTAFFIQNSWSSTNNDLLVSARRDDNESYGLHNTGNISWGNKITESTRLILSAATGFKAPSFNDLYYPDQFGYVGNPNILPETSENFEISLKRKNTQLNFYRTNITNLISWQLNTATSKTSPVNIGNSKISGVEFITSMKLSGWDTMMNISFTDPIDTSTGKVLENRSRESLRLDFDKSFSNYSLGATVKSQGIRYTSTDKLDSYTLVDLRANYKLSKDLSIKGKITNALEREYFLKSGYNTPDKSIYISLDYRGF